MQIILHTFLFLVFSSVTPTVAISSLKQSFCRVCDSVGCRLKTRNLIGRFANYSTVTSRSRITTIFCKQSSYAHKSKVRSSMCVSCLAVSRSFSRVTAISCLPCSYHFLRRKKRLFDEEILRYIPAREKHVQYTDRDITLSILSLVFSSYVSWQCHFHCVPTHIVFFPSL